MNRQTKLKIVGGVAAGVVAAGALGAAGAVAAGRAFSDDDRQAIIDDAAAELGVEPSALSDALKEGLKNRVDEAVEEGRLTEEQGERLKERIDANDLPLLGLGRAFGHGPFGGGGPGHHGAKLDLDSAASYLGLTSDELEAKLMNGETLAEIAAEEGKSVNGLVQELVDAAEKRIDEAVADGRLTEEQAVDLKEDLGERIRARVNDGFRTHRFGFRHGFGGFERPPALEGQPG